MMGSINGDDVFNAEQLLILTDESTYIDNLITKYAGRADLLSSEYIYSGTLLLLNFDQSLDIGTNYITPISS